MKQKVEFNLEDTPKNRAIIDAAQGDIIKIFEKTTISAVAESAATNKAIAGYLAETRSLVEDEALNVIAAMQLVFSEKSDSLKTLKRTAEEISAQSAFINSSLNLINAKKSEIDRLLISLGTLNCELERFERFAESGLLDKMHSIAEVMR